MVTFRPVALVLVVDCDDAQQLALLAANGFDVFTAPWQKAAFRGSRVRVRDISMLEANGSLRQIPGVLDCRPDVICCLSSRPDILARGFQLALASGAIWCHTSCGGSSSESVKPEWTARDISGFGIVRYDHGTAAFKLVSARSEVEDVRAVLTDLVTGLVDANGRCSALPMPRLLAPVGVLTQCGQTRLHDLLPAPTCLPMAMTLPILVDWLKHLSTSLIGPPPLELPSAANQPTGVAHRLGSEHFPVFFGTPQHIQTSIVPDAAFEYLDPRLEIVDPAVNEDSFAGLSRLLWRRRSQDSQGDIATSNVRLVETGVGRTCIVDGLRVKGAEQFRDFTVLGVGLTPFSESGFVDMGRKIDGKAALIRAEHRRENAERLEAAGCRTGCVVAIIRTPDETIEMTGDPASPACMVVRAFRCVLRVKQLDPVVCSLHSMQHTPLVYAYLEQRARDLQLDKDPEWVWTVKDDVQLAAALEAQGASQHSLRVLLRSKSDNNEMSWEALVRTARLEIIDRSAPPLLGIAKARLAKELSKSDEGVDDDEYIGWFAMTLGRQLSEWRRHRFLHDYHHPGVSRWQPGALYSLGENNVTLLAEFPDLDTGVFVNDDDDRLMSALQLTSADISLLREQFAILHTRDVVSAELVVDTLARVLRRGDEGFVSGACAKFNASYEAGIGGSAYVTARSSTT